MAEIKTIKGNLSLTVERISIEERIKTLGYVTVSDPCYVIGENDELWKFLCGHIFTDGDIYACHITNDDGAKISLIVGSTAYGDGSYDYQVLKSGDNYGTLSINTSISSGILGVDAGLIGIVTFNDDALKCGLIDREVADAVSMFGIGKDKPYINAIIDEMKSSSIEEMVLYWITLGTRSEILEIGLKGQISLHSKHKLPEKVLDKSIEFLLDNGLIHKTGERMNGNNIEPVYERTIIGGVVVFFMRDILLIEKSNGGEFSLLTFYNDRAGDYTYSFNGIPFESKHFIEDWDNDYDDAGNSLVCDECGLHYDNYTRISIETCRCDEKCEDCGELPEDCYCNEE